MDRLDWTVDGTGTGIEIESVNETYLPSFISFRYLLGWLKSYFSSDHRSSPSTSSLLNSLYMATTTNLPASLPPSYSFLRVQVLLKYSIFPLRTFVRYAYTGNLTCR